MNTWTTKTKVEEPAKIIWRTWTNKSPSEDMGDASPQEWLSWCFDRKRMPTICLVHWLYCIDEEIRRKCPQYVWLYCIVEEIRRECPQYVRSYCIVEEIRTQAGFWVKLKIRNFQLGRLHDPIDSNSLLYDPTQSR